MAAASFSLAVEDDLSCPVCYNLLKDPNTPKELDCSHICCAPCIEKMTEGGRRVVECPECRHVTRIPKNGVTAMKTAFRLRSLAEKHHEHAQKKDQASNNHSKSDKKLKPKDICSDSLCPSHNIIVNLFCKKCNVVGCTTCMWYSHKGPEHEVSEIVEVHREQKEQIASTLTQMDAEIDKCEQSIKDLKTLEVSMKQYSAQQKENLVKHSDLIIMNVKQSVRKLQENYDSIEQPKIERVQNERLRLQRRMTEMKDMKLSVQCTVDTCDSREYVKQHGTISRNVTAELRKDFKMPADLNPLIGKARLRIERPADLQLFTLAQVNVARLRLVQEFGGLWLGNSLSVTTTADGLIVVGFDKNTLNTYRRNKDAEYKKEATIKLSKKVTTANAYSVAISKDDTILVVRNGVCVEMYSRSGQYEGVLDLKPAPYGKGQEICKSIRPIYVLVEENGDLLVSHSKSGIVRFTSDGVFRYSILTAINPSRIAALPNRTLAVTNSRKNKLLIVDMMSGKDTLSVDIPNARAICYHAESDTLLVGRCLRRGDDGVLVNGTGVIEQYCPTSGRLVKQVFTGLTCPYDMILIRDDLLVVADFWSVKAFNITT